MINMAIREAAEQHIELIQPPFDELYRTMGHENFEKFFHYFGGQNVYVPTLRTVLSDAIKAKAVQECRECAMTHNEVAKKYGYTGRYLRKVVNGK